MRRWIRVTLAIGVVIALVVVGTVIWRTVHHPEASVASSSAQAGHEASKADPGVPGDWRPEGETADAWLQRTWSGPIDVRRVTIERGAAGGEGVSAGYLRFSDGSQLWVQLTGDSTVISVAERRVTSMRFTVIDLTDDDASVSLAELDADDGDGPGGDVVPASTQDGDVAAAGLGDETLAPLVDSDPATSADVGDGIELRWSRPQELSRVSIAGAAAGATLRSATLEFSDGSTLPFGGVTSDPTRPTTVGFMPRSTTSLRIVVDGTEGDGELALGELSVYDQGAPAAQPLGSGQPEAVAVDVACDADGRPADDAGVVVLCPTNGSTVGDRLKLVVAAGPAYSSVMAAPWAARGASAAPQATADLDEDGTAALDIDVSSVPVGPFTVSIAATGADSAVSKAFLHLVRPGQVSGSEPRDPPGRRPAFIDDFDQAVSINRTGLDADYASGKPTDGGVEDFGEAIFADPSLGLGNVEARDGYLRLAVQPRPADLEDPQGWGREHLGGMLASARQGGSGFSAQYGYFEARMLVPAAPGTWPAFWLLSNPNLVEPQPVVAEIDTLEHYGHNPTGACHTTHQYPDPENIGRAQCGERFMSEREASEWHTYGVDVRPDRIVYYIDGQQVADAPQVGAGDEPMFFLLDLALGGGWPIDLSLLGDRADLYVDWVRVYV